MTHVQTPLPAGAGSADSRSASPLSRRLVLRTAPVLAATTLAAGSALNLHAALAAAFPADPAAGPPAADDVELLELGRELARFIKLLAQLDGDLAPVRKALLDEVERRANVPEDQLSWTAAERKTYWESFKSAHEGAPPEYRQFEKDWNEACEHADDLVRRIAGLPARTMAGLGAKALATAFALDCQGSWHDEGRGQEYGTGKAVMLVQAVAALAGTTLPALQDDPDEV